MRQFMASNASCGSKVLTLEPDYFEERLVLFEEQRARLNHFFCSNIESREEGEADRFEEPHLEFHK
jgi:hypothetical protein